MSLALTLMHIFAEDRLGDLTKTQKQILRQVIGKSETDTEYLVRSRFGVAETIGQSNNKMVELANPSSNTMEKLFYTLCAGVCHTTSQKNPGLTQTNPLEELNEFQFQVY